MTKQEIALTNYAQQISTAYMVVDIGDKLSYGESHADLLLRVDQIEILQDLFDAEYAKGDDTDTNLLIEIVNHINTLINDYRLTGEHIVDEVLILPTKPSLTVIKVFGEGNNNNPNPEQPSNLINTLKITPPDFLPNWVYSNPALIGVGYDLDISGGAQLVLGLHYIKLPGGGFQLINGVTLAEEDFIILHSYERFPSGPITPQDDSFPYLLDYQLPQ